MNFFIFSSWYQCKVLAADCTQTTPYETTTCFDGTTSCYRRCYWEGVQTSFAQFNALSNLSIACDSSLWKEAGSLTFANWCNGVNNNDQCGDDLIYDPCTGELWQTPEDVQYAGSYWYGIDATKQWDVRITRLSLSLLPFFLIFYCLLKMWRRRVLF